MQNIEKLQQVIKEWAMPHIQGMFKEMVPMLKMPAPKWLSMFGAPETIDLSTDVMILGDPIINTGLSKIKKLSSFVDDADIPTFSKQVVENIIIVSEQKGGYYDVLSMGIISLPTKTFQDLREKLEEVFPERAQEIIIPKKEEEQQKQKENEEQI